MSPTWFVGVDQAVNTDQVTELRVIQRAGKWHVAAYLEATPGRPEILVGSGFSNKADARVKLLQITGRTTPQETE